MKSEELRQAFTKFFVDRQHVALAPASLVANDPTILFTIAGMVPFRPYFLGEAEPANKRVTTIQPCLRVVDIDVVGRTARHCTFFEMLGNFSFGDYFKEKAIPWAWEFVTEVLGFEQERLWATVHLSDDEAAEIWPDATSLPAERVQRLGEDNFWQMGETGPCGPSSEIFFDRGEAFGPPGGPAGPGAEESGRYVEVWNLVFTQFDRAADGELSPLPRRNIDTGAGLDRLLAVLQDVPHVQAIDCVAPILERAAELTKSPLVPGSDSETTLRIIADHSRAFTFAILDGVFPSNEGRGYVLRRLVRRVVLRAQQLGRTEPLTPELVEAVAGTMGSAYPRLSAEMERIKTVALHEEEAFLRTLRQGSSLLEQELARSKSISGETAFLLHDTFGFPVELTREIASERGLSVDEAGYEEKMEAQRKRARQGRRRAVATGEEQTARWKEVRQAHGPTEFVGYEETSVETRLLAVVPSGVGSDFENVDGERAPEGRELVEVFLQRTPFYAEGGGQVGDSGTITTATGSFRVLDTTAVLEGLSRHLGYVQEGDLEEGSQALAAIDVERRDAIRRNHTGTHLLHHALRSVLGEHVRQQGSLVAPDRLRFDFSHFGPLSEGEIEKVEALVNETVIANEPVRTVKTSRGEAEAEGAIAFFGEKYGETVRVVHAGGSSVELCGGTHVSALGTIGPMRIVSESSIGANTRRLEAVTGSAALEEIRRTTRRLGSLAELLHSTPEEAPAALRRLVERQRIAEDELNTLRLASLRQKASELAGEARDSVVVARLDGLDAVSLRELALAVRDQPSVDGAGLVAVAEGRVSIVVAVTKGRGLDAREAASAAAREVGGGGGGTPELATAGGRDESAAGRALEVLSDRLRPAR